MNDISTTSVAYTAEMYLRNLQKEELGKVYADLSIDQISSMVAEHPLIEPFWREAVPSEREQFLHNYSSEFSNTFDSFGFHLRAIQHNIIELCPSEHKLKISEVPVGALRIFEVNARTKLSPEGMPIVIVHHGLMGFAQDITNIIVANLFTLNSMYYKQGHFNCVDHYKEMSKKAIMSCLSFLSERRVVPKDHLIAPSEEWKKSFLECNC